MRGSSEIREQFAKKLEEFVKTMNDDEVILFKEVMERAGGNESQLARAVPGVLGSTSLAARVQLLDSAFFSKMLDW